MKKIALFVVMFVAASVFAGVVGDNLYQYTHAVMLVNDVVYDYPNTGDYKDYKPAGQVNWETDRLITLSVKKDTSVWLTHKVDSLYYIPDLNTVADVSPYKYGYIDVANPGTVVYSEGGTKEITYSATENPSVTGKTTGYLLGEFDKDMEIYLVMTSLEGDEVNSMQRVNENAENPTTVLASRSEDYVDNAGNVVVNFGLNRGTSFEFVAVYEKTAPTSGQPLPGLLMAGLLSIGSVLTGAGLKRKQN